MDITTKSGQRIRRLLGGRSNVYLLTAGTRALLIDTGRTRRLGRIVSRLDRLKIDRLDAILLTHTHFDHAENTAALSERFGAKIIVQKQEAGALNAGDSRLPRGSIPVTRWLMPRISPWLQPRVAYRPTSPDLLVGEAMGLRALGFEATVLHTPGHSPGSASLMVEDQIALVGDTLLGTLPRSVFPPFADDPWEMVRSWGKLLGTGCTLFLPGHGWPITRDRLECQYAKHRRAVPLTEP